MRRPAPIERESPLHAGASFFREEVNAAWAQFNCETYAATSAPYRRYLSTDGLIVGAEGVNEDAEEP